jgi:UDP-glucose 4-epimerase
MPKAIVTGAYGFVGRHVARHFAKEGWQVAGIGHGSWAREEWKEWGLRDWHTCDITLETLLTYAGEPDAIIHCAGSGSVGFSMTHPLQDYGRTVSTMLSVLEFARLHSPGTRVVYPSSAAVYGSADRLPISEDFPMRPTSPYGVHKYMAEELCQSYARHFRCHASIVRLFSVYGPGLRKQLLWDACNKIKAGDKAFFGTGREVRDWVHVDDAASLLLAAAGRAAPDCPVVNGATGIGVAVRDVLELVFGCLGRKDSPEFSDAARPGDPAAYVGDISQASALMRWSPSVSWREGIRDYAEWFKEVDL